MAGSRDIKNRMKSVQSTHQITKAMEIVSTTKFKKFSGIVEKSKAYSIALKQVLKNISAGVKNETHPLFSGRNEVNNICVILMTSDRGLCGSFNNNTLKNLESLVKNNPGKKVSVITIGKKAYEFSAKRNYPIQSSYTQLTPEIMFDAAKEMSEDIVKYYYENTFDEVYMIYNEYYSPVRYELVTEKIIPIVRVESTENINYIFEPDGETVLSSLLPKYLSSSVYTALLHNTASEHSARKNAMKSATENAEEMIKALNLQYNRERQAAITQEISEIVGGAASMK